MVDPDEDPLETAKRELLEETDYSTISIELIGTCATCSSRISMTKSGLTIARRKSPADINHVVRRSTGARAAPSRNVEAGVLDARFRR